MSPPSGCANPGKLLGIKSVTVIPFAVVILGMFLNGGRLRTCGADVDRKLGRKRLGMNYIVYEGVASMLYICRIVALWLLHNRNRSTRSKISNEI